MGIRYLLFDLDGTLIDTTNLILSCYRASAHRLVDCPPTDEEILKGFGRPLPDQLWRLFPTLRDRLPEVELLWHQAQDKLHDDLIRPFPDTREVLAQLRQRGYRLGIVTSKERVMAERGMSMYGILPLMDAVVTVEDTTRHKPDPEPVLKGIQALFAPVAETVYIGDSLHDMKAGRAAGVKVAAAMWGPFAKEPLREFQPDYLLERLGDLLELFPPLEAVHGGLASERFLS